MGLGSVLCSYCGHAPLRWSPPFCHQLHARVANCTCDHCPHQLRAYDEGVSASTIPADGTKPLSRAELLGLFAFWTLMAVLTAANRIADQRDVVFTAVPHAVPIGLAFQQMYLWALLTPLLLWLAGRFSVERSSTWVKVLILIAVGLGIAFSVDLFNSALVRFFDARPARGASILGPSRDGGPGSLSDPFSVLRGPMILNHFILFWGVLAAGF